MYRLYDLLEAISMREARIGEYRTKTEMLNGAQERIEDTDGECLLAYCVADENGKYKRSNLVFL